MKQQACVYGCRGIQFLVLVFLLDSIIGCSFGGGLKEFDGVVVGKNGSNQILVVPNVDGDMIQNLSEAERLEIARTYKGVYFSVDAETFDTVTVGTRVVVHYDPNNGEEVSVPPRRHSEHVEILLDEP